MYFFCIISMIFINLFCKNLIRVVFLLLQEYDDGYGAAYDDQGFETYDNDYNNQGQK